MDNAALSTGDIDFTIAGWVYLDSLPGSGGQTFVSKWAAGQKEYTLLQEFNSPNNRFIFYVSSDGTAVTTVNANTLGTPSIATWYFIVAWHDSVANTINIQVNNGTADSVAYTSGLINGTSAINLGSLNGTAGYYHNGRMDEFGFWKKVLTSAEKTDLYNSGNANTFNKAYKIVQPTANTTRLYNYSGTTQNVRLDVSTQAFQVKQQDANTVRLYNYSGSAQNLRLDVITGGLGRNAGTISLAPAAADVDAQDAVNSIWVNKTGLDGSILKLQKSGTDILKVSQAGSNAALILDQRLSGDIFSASASGTTRLTLENDGDLLAGGVFAGLSGTNTRLRATGTSTGSTGTGSIYFLNSSGTTAGRFDTTTMTATGGTIATSSGYTTHTFTSGTNTFTPSIAENVEYLVVAGGGAVLVRAVAQVVLKLLQDSLLLLKDTPLLLGVVVRAQQML